MELDHLRRHLFPNTQEHALLRQVLMAQDGSTTRLCAALAKGSLELAMYLQERHSDVPRLVKEALGGSAWLERVTCLHAGGEVMMDNLSFTRLDNAPEWFLAELDRGAAPVGRLLESLFVRREAAPASPDVARLLWDRVGLPDPEHSRSYVVRMSEGPLMYIYETYRAGLVS